MYVETYRYTVKKGSLAQWRSITAAAAKRYRALGHTGTWQGLTRPDKHGIAVLDINYYPTKAECVAVGKKSRKDPEVLALYKALTLMLATPKIEKAVFTL